MENTNHAVNCRILFRPFVHKGIYEIQIEIFIKIEKFERLETNMHSTALIFLALFFNCVFIVDSTQHRRYLDLTSLMVGKFYKPPAIRRDLAPQTHTGATQDRTRAHQHRRPACRHWQYNYYVDQATDDPKLSDTYFSEIE